MRWEGYREALEERGVPYDDSLVRVVGYAAEEAVTATRDLMRDPSIRPTAIFAATFMTRRVRCARCTAVSPYPMRFR